MQFICSAPAQARDSLTFWAAKEANVRKNCRIIRVSGKTPRAIESPGTEMLAKLNANIRAPPGCTPMIAYCSSCEKDSLTAQDRDNPMTQRGPLARFICRSLCLDEVFTKSSTLPPDSN